MNVLSAGYKILTPISDGGIKELQRIEEAGRVCYKSEDRITSDGESAKKFVAMLITNGHEAMLEHSSLSVKFIVDRGVSHEIVRHRIASYAMESTRYVNYSKEKFGNEISVINISDSIKYDNKMSKMPDEKIGEIIATWHSTITEAEKGYMKMIELGATPQIARSVLPNSTKTELVMTSNYREWRNFFKLRTDYHAHPAIREVSIPLLLELKCKIPVVFDDIRPFKR